MDEWGGCEEKTKAEYKSGVLRGVKDGLCGLNGLMRRMDWMSLMELMGKEWGG